MGKPAVGAKVALACQQEFPAGPLVLFIQQDGSCISEHVVPHLLGLEVLQSIQVLLSVVEVVLEGAVTVVTEVPGTTSKPKPDTAQAAATGHCRANSTCTDDFGP